MSTTPKNYLRIRPKDSEKGAFYAPAADVTNGMPAVVRQALAQLAGDPLEDSHPLMELARNLAVFMKKSALSEQLWEEDALPFLDKIFENVPDEDRSRFLLAFFNSVMDFYWHCMRLTTEAPEIAPKGMEKALAISGLVRTMPAALRTSYLEHIHAFNLSTPALEQGPLFFYTGEEEDGKKDE